MRSAVCYAAEPTRCERVVQLVARKKMYWCETTFQQKQAGVDAVYYTFTGVNN